MEKKKILSIAFWPICIVFYIGACVAELVYLIFVLLLVTRKMTWTFLKKEIKDLVDLTPILHPLFYYKS